MEAGSMILEVMIPLQPTLNKELYTRPPKIKNHQILMVSLFKSII